MDNCGFYSKSSLKFENSRFYIDLSDAIMNIMKKFVIFKDRKIYVFIRIIIFFKMLITTQMFYMSRHIGNKKKTTFSITDFSIYNKRGKYMKIQLHTYKRLYLILEKQIFPGHLTSCIYIKIQQYVKSVKFS